MTTLTDPTRNTLQAEGPRRDGSVWCLLAILAGVAVFWAGSESLLQAWSLPEYSHGPLIPVLSLYLFLRQLKTVPPAEGRITDRWPGVAVIAAALFLGFLGNLARVPDIVTYAMIVWVFGILLVGFGWSRGKEFWPAVVHLVFMLPLPAIIYWQVSINLQFISSELGVWFIRLMNIPVFLEGNIIDLGVFKLHVAEACSGLRYLFSVMSFSYVFSVLYQGPMWHKAVLLLSAAPITIVMNSVRIGIIGIVVDNYGISYAEGFLHMFEGWAVFIACILILFGLARIMQRLAGDRRPLHKALDLDLSGLGTQAARSLRIKGSAAMVAAALMTGGLAGFWHLTPERTAMAVEREPLVLFPPFLGEWTAGPQQRLDPEIEAVLGADDYYSAAFTAPDQTVGVDLFIAWYAKQTDGSGLHSPEVCIPAGGWEMSRLTQMTIPVTREKGETVALPVNRAVIQLGLQRQLVYYWFEQRGRSMTSDYLAKAVTLMDAVTTGRTDGALVRLVTPIPSGETEAQADERLQAFLTDSLGILPRFVPD
ncbi:MAG: hypothetical protein Kilf2KO_06370 [Rhodospirillales bacterium]